MAIELNDLVAQPNFAPKKWQSTAPDSAWSPKPAVADSAELKRIIALPRRDRPNSEEAEQLIQLITGRYYRENKRCNCHELRKEVENPCIKRLRLAQAWALFEIRIQAGLLGPIGVGHGKTILDLLAPLAIQNCKLALLLVPPNLLGQLAAEYHLVSQHFRVPSLVVHGRELRVMKEGEPVLHVFPYSRLSRHENTTFIEDLKPDLIIADECDKLRHAETATTSRVLRYFAAFPDTRFCAWTGSMTDSKIEDYAHLSALALRHWSPLPLDPHIVEDWGRALNPQEFPAPAGALLKLCEAGESVRSGFHRRLVDSLGVVTTKEPAVDIELKIFERYASDVPVSVIDALDTLRDTWTRPDGEELVDALSLSRCACELACGFYYRWIFPRGEPMALIVEWLEARKLWNREVRDKLRARVSHLDSEYLCTRAAMRAWGDLEEDENLPNWKVNAWPRWREVKGKVQPETEAVRVDDYLVLDAAAWAKENRGIVWYGHRAFGEWLAEVSGLPLHSGGNKAGERIGCEKGDRSIIASVKSHGRGRDGLQFKFCKQLIANPPSSATDWEQLLGRLHRVGQTAECVTAEFYSHTPELEAHVIDAMKRAEYVQATFGSTQKLKSGYRK